MRAHGVHPAAKSVFAARLATRQAWRSPAAPAQPCFWLAWPSASTTMRARECRRSSAVVRQYARSFYSSLLCAAHDKAQSHAAPLCALTSTLRGSTGAVLQRGPVRVSGLTPEIRERRGLSVRLLHHDHRDAGGERAAPRIPAPAPLATPKVGATRGVGYSSSPRQGRWKPA